MISLVVCYARPTEYHSTFNEPHTRTCSTLKSSNFLVWINSFIWISSFVFFSFLTEIQLDLIGLNLDSDALLWVGDFVSVSFTNNANGPVLTLVSCWSDNHPDRQYTAGESSSEKNLTKYGPDSGHIANLLEPMPSWASVNGPGLFTRCQRESIPINETLSWSLTLVGGRIECATTAISTCWQHPPKTRKHSRPAQQPAKENELSSYDCFACYFRSKLLQLDSTLDTNFSRHVDQNFLFFLSRLNQQESEIRLKMERA